MVTKLAEIISSSDNDVYNQETQLGTYVMIIYFISIIGIIVGYIWLSDNKSKSETPNWIVRWSLNIGGVLLLIYTMLNYWDYLGDYSKLSLISLSIFCITYYLYKFY
jgi:RsiW-degrading membrane proteinase PrsW (M82 family)